MFRFLLTPKWIATTLVCILVLPGFQALSVWQWHRLDARHIYNNEILSKISQPPVVLSDLLVDNSEPPIAKSNSEWRVIEATGTWLPQDQVLVRKKSLESDLGLWVITPLQLPDGTVIMVNRGWTPAANSAVDSPTLAQIPSGEVEVLGRVREVRPRDGVAPADLPLGQVDQIIPTEINSSGNTIGNIYLEMTASRPESRTSEIRELPAPEITEGPHRSYAVQWILFAIMTVIGWVILVRNEVKVQRANQDSVSEVSAN